MEIYQSLNMKQCGVYRFQMIFFDWVECNEQDISLGLAMALEQKNRGVCWKI
ncbi:hypothetical protein MIZ03_2211 [Rhodoferax lithotrophicus]|uniref:Uncharacterized protein n=1 Tax=Rhodoferax lithotrophicus TaxID=2798804 RepID=A0ABN6DBF8_9BURK|nr:hypothetical protein MIZ03_2211 [Rhodoferax sp. MIZ03]